MDKKLYVINRGLSRSHKAMRMCSSHVVECWNELRLMADNEVRFPVYVKYKLGEGKIRG